MSDKERIKRLEQLVTVLIRMAALREWDLLRIVARDHDVDITKFLIEIDDTEVGRA